MGTFRDGLRIGFIIPVLNGGEHLSGLLAQIVNLGKVVAIEGADGLNDPSEHRSFLSVDKTSEILKEFHEVMYCPLGKTSDPRNLLNKGLQLLNDADYFIVLDQSDYFVDLDQILMELPRHDFLTARKKVFWKDFGHFVDQDVELGFRNFGELKFSDSMSRVQLPNGEVLAKAGYSGRMLKDVMVNFRYITSDAKRVKILMKETKLHRFYSFGVIAAKNTTKEHLRDPSPIRQTPHDSYLHNISHPWRDKDAMFFERLPVFPSIDDVGWEAPSDQKIRELRLQENFQLPRVLAWNCPELRTKFEAEGWDFSVEKVGPFDLIYSIGEIPERTEIKNLLKSQGRLVVIDSELTMVDSEFDIEFLEKKNERYSFAASRRWKHV